VILDKKFGSPLITKDGVTVAKEIELCDPFENMGAQMIKEVASKTSDTAGDGTTTATVLAHAMIHEGLRYLAGGMNPMDLKRGMEQAIEAVVAELKRIARPCRTSQEIAHVASISANNDRSIGDLLARAIDKVGREGAISIEDGSALASELEVVEGLQFDRLGHQHAGVDDLRRAEVALQDDGAAARAQGYLHRLGQRVHTAADLLACFIAEAQLLCHHSLALPQLRGQWCAALRARH